MEVFSQSHHLPMWRTQFSCGFSCEFRLVFCPHRENYWWLNFGCGRVDPNLLMVDSTLYNIHVEPSICSVFCYFFPEIINARIWHTTICHSQIEIMKFYWYVISFCMKSDVDPAEFNAFELSAIRLIANAAQFDSLHLWNWTFISTN